MNFNDVVIIRNALFTGAEIGGSAWFGGAKIGGSAWFRGAKIGGSAWFRGDYVSFNKAEIGRDAWFDYAKIHGSALFGNAKIGGDASFGNAEIGGTASFDEAEIGGDAWFDLLEIKGKLRFKDAKFEKTEAQEEACRKAKTVWEEFGDRIEVDYYFYREMEAKRKQKYKKFSLKPILKLIRKLRLEKLVGKHIKSLEKERRIYWGFLELPVQYIFGYGVHPRNVIVTWLLTVIALAFVYWIGNGVLVGGELEVAADSFWEYFYFSAVTAATPGYGGYRPAPGFYLKLAIFEAIFGTFMWAAFIATFARKYMR